MPPVTVDLDATVNSCQAFLLLKTEDREFFAWPVCSSLGKENRELLPRLEIALALLSIGLGVRIRVKSGTKVGRHAVIMEA